MKFSLVSEIELVFIDEIKQTNPELYSKIFVNYKNKNLNDFLFSEEGRCFKLSGGSVQGKMFVSEEPDSHAII